jgi:hypothetical protein
LHHDSAGLPVGLVVVDLASDLVVTLHSNLGKKGCDETRDE